MARTFYGDFCDAMDDWAQSEHPFRPFLIGALIGLAPFIAMWWFSHG